jgi:hypothetical protein
MPKPADLSVTGLRRRHVLTLLGMVGVSAREREPLRGVGVGGDGRHRGGPRRKHGGQILLHPAAYFGRVFLPSLVSWLAGLGVTAVFLAAYAIPLTFHTVMAVTGGSLIANVTSVAAGGPASSRRSTSRRSGA